MLKLAACQIDITLGEVRTNLDLVLERFAKAAAQGAQLVVFPECSLSGYGFDSAAEARASALSWSSDYWLELLALCDRFNAYCVCGFVEQDGALLYNTTGLFGPGGFRRRYRKVHTLVLGVDRFVAPGDLGFSVFDLPIGRLGINVCYDQRFPESARTLMLQGAQLILVPTNEPIAAADVCDLLTRARAFENHVFYLWVNRVGTERGTTYMGATQLIAPTGEVLFRLGMAESRTEFAEIDLALADRKHIVREPGVYELDLLNDRVPEVYSVIAKKRSDVG